MENILHTFITGIFIGALYGLIGLGIGLLMGIMKFINIAHGTFLILGGYISFWLFSLLGIDPYLGIPVAMIVMFAVGLVLYWLVLSNLVKLPSIGMRIDTSLLITFGIIYVLDNVMTFVWKPDVRSIVTTYTGETVQILGTKLSVTGLCGLGIALLISTALYLIMEKTLFGKHVRAAAQDSDAAGLCGINVNRTYLLSCGIALALAGAAGTVIVSSYSITPTGGLSWLLIAFVVMIVAGEGNLNALLPAGLLLGVVEAMSVFVVGPQYRQAVMLVLFILMLVFRPNGLFTLRR